MLVQLRVNCWTWWSVCRPDWLPPRTQPERRCLISMVWKYCWMGAPRTGAGSVLMGAAPLSGPGPVQHPPDSSLPSGFCQVAQLLSWSPGCSSCCAPLPGHRARVSVLCSADVQPSQSGLFSSVLAQAFMVLTFVVVTWLPKPFVLLFHIFLFFFPKISLSFAERPWPLQAQRGARGLIEVGDG